MSARHVFPTALFLASVAVAPAGAQDPPAVPEQSAPAPAQAVARARGDREVDRSAASARITRERNDGEAPVVRSRVRPVTEVPPAAAVAEGVTTDEEQGGRRRPGAGGGNAGGAGPRGGGSAGGTGPRGGGGRAAGGDNSARPRGGVRNPESGWGRGENGGNGNTGNRSAQAVPRGRAPQSGQVFDNRSYGRRYFAGTGGLNYYFYDPWSWYGGYGWPGYAAYGGWGGGWGGGWAGAWNQGWGGGWGPGWGGGLGNYGGPYGWSIGGVRLRVNEKDAEVYVDGYYAGIVDDFDGRWQQLRLDDGGYRIEVRKPGLTPLTFDVRVQPGRTITYRGQMTPAP